jgi:hypothetical protein
MKERFLDVIKWGLILIIAGAVFFWVYPKYYFDHSQKAIWTRGNKMTGKIEVCLGVRDKWFELGKHNPYQKPKKELKEKGRFIFEGLEKAEPKP